MKRTANITCRYGVTYACTANGSYGETWRLFDMLSRCCCYVCHNRDCKEPRNRKLRNCNRDCQLYTRTPYCQSKKAEGGDHADA